MTGDVWTGMLLAGVAGLGIGIGVMTVAALRAMVRRWWNGDDTPKR